MSRGIFEEIGKLFLKLADNEREAMMAVDPAVPGTDRTAEVSRTLVPPAPPVQTVDIPVPPAPVEAKIEVVPTPPPVAEAPVATVPAIATHVELDGDGLPWDARIHGKAKAKNKSGEWRLTKGVDRALVDTVLAELKEQTGLPAVEYTVPTPPPVAEAPVVPASIPVPPPAVTAPAPPVSADNDWPTDLENGLTPWATGKLRFHAPHLTVAQITNVCVEMGYNNMGELIASNDVTRIPVFCGKVDDICALLGTTPS